MNHSSNTNNNNNNNNKNNNTTNTNNNNNNNSAGKEMMSALTRTTQQPAKAPPARKNGVFARKMHHSSPGRQRSPTDDDNEAVRINISGKRFETYLATLQRFPNSLLGDASKRAHFYNESSGEYFFDRHRKAFSGILHYYQSNGLLERPEGVSETIFTQEVMFFELGDINALHYEDQSDSENLQQDFQVPSNPFFQTIWVLFERPKSSLAANILAVVSVVIILLSIVVFCVETIPSLNPDRDEGQHMKNTWFLLNSVCNGWFTLEYVLRLIVSPNRLAFIRSTQNIIDLISILPYYMTLAIGGSSGNNYIVVLRVVRVVRVVRIFKLTRHSRGLHVLANTIRASFQELAMLCMFLAIGVILFASAVYFAESNQDGTKFKSIPHAFWWAVVTMTTVGYGDIAPETLFGKLIGTLCAISGVLVIALPVPVIVSNFEHFYKEEQARKAREKEITKKEKLDDKLLPMKQSLRLMTQSSILFTGLDSTQQESINSSTKSHRSISIGSIRRNSSTYKTETSLYPPPHCPNEGFVLSPPC